MVRIINYKERTSEDGKNFFVLEVQGGIEMVRSHQTGKFYATARKASITSTFDELTCKALIGTEMPGKISKVECEPYEYTIRDTGEIITLTHRFDYEPDDAPVAKFTKAMPVEKSEATIDTFINW
ncbi:hypothetical protein OGH69_15385 [Flavobacterium sp. MFBS3-15]|uniref:hypothetical protein n=1 Tax=Flavobacterium sp. MFBS3-15 TaxID=2989816 RepID=UPI002235B200|nr:hypothetical protein [Flavobacterium sp. MFBS3-15]MCW4470356.1 hypothetical protein [Flavobacterium sp. MFBS3-15]